MTFASRSRRVWVPVCSALALAVLVAPTAQAHSTSHAGVTKCKTVTGAHWSIREAAGKVSGTRYNVSVEGVSCAFALRLVPALTRKRNSGTPPKGPGRYRCLSFSVAASGDKLLYSGVCKIAPGVPFFEWGPKV